MREMKQAKIPAVYMRGGTSKGVFFRAGDLPRGREARDKIFLKVVGSPDPYGKQIDGMGCGTSSTSKVVVIGPSSREDCDVDYLFGAVSIGDSIVDYSGNCGNLSSAVGPFAIHCGLVEAPEDGIAQVRIWQQNTRRRIIAQVPTAAGEVRELGNFQLAGVTFPAAEIILDFLDPVPDGGAVFPTGNVSDYLDIPSLGKLEATLINVGLPHVILRSAALGLRGDELPGEMGNSRSLLPTYEVIRSHGAVLMGLADNPEEITRNRPHTPKLVLISEPRDYTTSSGRGIGAGEIDVQARILSMGKPHHAMTGTGGIALSAAAEIDGTLVNQVLMNHHASALLPTRIGHPSGVMAVKATTSCSDGMWHVEKVTMSRSARRLMEGWVFA